MEYTRIIQIPGLMVAIDFEKAFDSISWILLGDIRVHPTARLKYNSLFDDQNLDWKQIYLIPHKVTLDVKTRMFQFKILNRIIYTNKLLNKMRLTDTSLCTFCGEYEESLEHFFFTLQIYQRFLDAYY